MGPQKIELVTTLETIKGENVPAGKMNAPKGFKKTSFEDFNQMQAGMAKR